MDKREFLKKGTFGVALVMFAPSLVRAKSSNATGIDVPHIFKTFKEAEEFIGSDTLKEHFTNHYIRVAEKLQRELHIRNIHQPLKKLFVNSFSVDPNLLETASEFFNHRIFWKLISPSQSGNIISNGLEGKINKSFGSLNNLHQELYSAALDLKGKNGWVWLTYAENRLSVVNTPGNQNPFFASLPKQKQGYPLISIDMWEHAYNKDYNTIEEYCNSFFNSINWTYVSRRYQITNQHYL
jgi:superoxide dismutase, Fe-Mn family